MKRNEGLGKFDAQLDISIFLGYSALRKAYIFNKNPCIVIVH